MVFERQRRESKSDHRDQPREWISWKIREISLILMLAVTTCLIVGVSVLLALSEINHGFVDVTDKSTHFLVTWDIGLAWTTVPSFILQIFSLVFGVIITSFGFRQPFIELRRGATAEKSIALDYQSYFSGQNAYQAVKNRHWHLAIPFVVSMLLTLVVPPLASRMISDQAYAILQDKNVVQNQSFLGELGLNDSLNWDLAPMIGLTSATTVYGGSYARTLDSWVDEDGHAFLNFSTPELPNGNVTQPTLTAKTSAYFSKLDCRILDNDGDDNLWEIDIGGNNSTYGEFSANATDRGCEWAILFDIGASFTTYLQTKSVVSCGSYGASDSSGRLIIVGAQIETFQLSRLTMLSCVPTYWTSNGSLTLDLDPNSLRPIKSWAEDNATVQELRPSWWNSYETQTEQIQFVDTSTGLHADSTTAVGSLILAYTRRTSTDPLSGDSMVKAAEAVWSTMYGTTVNTFMLQTAETRQLQAQLSATVSKLVVSTIIASIIIGFLTVVGLTLVFILEYTKRHSSVLFEEPIGVLGYAGLLYNSELNGMIANAREPSDFRGRTTKDILQALHRGGVWTMENAGDPRTARIVTGVGPGSQEMTSLRRPLIQAQVSETQISEVHDSEAQRSEHPASEISPVEPETSRAQPVTTHEAGVEAQDLHNQTPEPQSHGDRLNEAIPNEAQIHQIQS